MLDLICLERNASTQRCTSGALAVPSSADRPQHFCGDGCLLQGRPPAGRLPKYFPFALSCWNAGRSAVLAQTYNVSALTPCACVLQYGVRNHCPASPRGAEQALYGFYTNPSAATHLRPHHFDPCVPQPVSRICVVRHKLNSGQNHVLTRHRNLSGYLLARYHVIRAVLRFFLCTALHRSQWWSPQLSRESGLRQSHPHPAVPTRGSMDRTAPWSDAGH